MTVHVVSVGTGIVDFLADPRNERYGLDRAFARRIGNAGPSGLVPAQTGRSDEVDAWLTRCLGGDGAAERAALGRMCEVVRPSAWYPQRVSAELDTFRSTGARLPLPDDDVAVLIASDTAGGLTAALWNAVAITDGDLDRIRYVPDAGHVGPLAPVRGRVLIARVLGMNAGTDQGFRTAMRGLGMLGKALVERAGIPSDEPVRFYLSGGYKAAIPYLIALAEGLRSLASDTGARQVDAYVLHEDTQGDAIRLPLRRFTPPSIRTELGGGWDRDGRRTTLPGAGLLEGYAYEPAGDGKGWRLTAFGDGLRALFGLSGEGLLR